MKFMDRRVVLSPTEPVPPGMRLAPGIVAVTAQEFRGLQRGDVATREALQWLIHQQERAALRAELARMERQ